MNSSAITFLSLSSALLIACAALGGRTDAPHEHVVAADEREVVCWGDSMTKGVGADVAVIPMPEGAYDASYKSYPEVLQDLCGLPTFNFGVSGATSKEIVSMQAGADEPLFEEEFDDVDPLVVECGRQHPGDILVLEIGSNGGWDNDYDELIAQYHAMIDHAGTEQYLIVGDTDDPGTSLGDENQEPFDEGEGPGETMWEAALREEFGTHFVNMRVYLIENGLDLCGMSETEEEEELASFGCVTDRLRSDWTHLNSYGYYAKGRGIYERGVELGYWK